MFEFYFVTVIILLITGAMCSAGNMIGVIYGIGVSIVICLSLITSVLIEISEKLDNKDKNDK